MAQAMITQKNSEVDIDLQKRGEDDFDVKQVTQNSLVK